MFIDTMGFAFTLPLAKLWFGCRTGAYVHYPTISTNMLHSVRTRKRGFNNRAIIADSRLATNGKIIYYKVKKMFEFNADACDVRAQQQRPDDEFFSFSPICTDSLDAVLMSSWSTQRGPRVTLAPSGAESLMFAAFIRLVMSTTCSRFPEKMTLTS